MHQPVVTTFRVDCRAAPPGPYRGTSELLRQLVPEILRRAPALLPKHTHTLISIRDDLRAQIPVSDEIARSFAFSREGNAKVWTLRLAHGVVDLLVEWAGQGGPLTLEFANARAADSLDHELLAVLARRAGERIALSVSDGEADADLIDRPTDAPALLARSEACMRLAYYQASLDFAERGLAIFDGDPAGAVYGQLGRNRLFSLMPLGRLDEVERFCDEVRARRENLLLRSHCAYAMGILSVRLLPEARRDLAAARGFVEEALALTEEAPPTDGRVVNLVFLRNTLALIEMRGGNHLRALQLLDEGLARLARDAPACFEVESVVLLQNRARLRQILGQTERALADYAQLLAHEPSNADAWLERGLLHQRAGRFAEALPDYERAIAWGPPHEYPHFNRGQALVALGRSDEALADFTRVLELVPEHVPARVERAGIHFRRGDDAAARAEVDRLLEIAPDHPKGLTLLGLLAQRQRRWDEAEAAFTRAIAGDPREPSAFINRATLAVRRGSLEAALADLDRAIALREDRDAYFNRARLHHTQRRWTEAIADYRRALALGAERELIAGPLERCRRALNTD